ncbi:MAG: hypothetical protein K1X64_12145 [Myxococcaceae bacterium]|nr:hypothetical protein [Myxococcaceae bacterium]
MNPRARWLSVAIFLSGCGLIQFDVEEALPEQRVAGNPLGGVLPSFVPTPFKLNIDLKAETEKRGTGPATHAFLKELTLSVTPKSKPSGNFNFLDEVHISIAPTSGSLPKVEIARAAPVAKALTVLNFELVPNVDLLPYMNAGAELTANATGQQPSSDVTFDGKVVVNVKL